MKKSVKIALCVGVGLVVAIGVCAGLIITNKAQETEQKVDYSTILEKTHEIAKGKNAVEVFLNTQAKAAKLSDEEKKVAEEFEKVIPEDKAMQDLLQKIKDINAGKSEEIEKATDEVALSYIHLRTLFLAEQDMKVAFDGELSDQDLESLSNSENDYLSKMAKDMIGYRAKVKKLNAKDKEFEKNYKSLVSEGEALQKKYADVKIEDLVGKNKEELLMFYDKIDELNKYLEEWTQK